MNIKINGKLQDSFALTLHELVISKSLNPEKVVIEHNRKLIPRDKWAEVKISDNDNIELISFVGGG